MLQTQAHRRSATISLETNTFIGLINDVMIELRPICVVVPRSSALFMNRIESRALKDIMELHQHVFFKAR